MKRRRGAFLIDAIVAAAAAAAILTVTARWTTETRTMDRFSEIHEEIAAQHVAAGHALLNLIKSDPFTYTNTSSPSSRLSGSGAGFLPSDWMNGHQPNRLGTTYEANIRATAGTYPNLAAIIPVGNSTSGMATAGIDTSSAAQIESLQQRIAQRINATSPFTALLVRNGTLVDSVTGNAVPSYSSLLTGNTDPYGVVTVVLQNADDGYWLVNYSGIFRKMIDASRSGFLNSSAITTSTQADVALAQNTITFSGFARSCPAGGITPAAFRAPPFSYTSTANVLGPTTNNPNLWFARAETAVTAEVVLCLPVSRPVVTTLAALGPSTIPDLFVAPAPAAATDCGSGTPPWAAYFARNLKIGTQTYGLAVVAVEQGDNVTVGVGLSNAALAANTLSLTYAGAGGETCSVTANLARSDVSTASIPTTVMR